ncbi:hypothetical protein EYE40_09090 [Glaciihabitans arcticus]|uniref:Secreted protein n=1 Tax=Glaciihabitans arcticus TaxID=2668039 RepID=A0A4Q9GS97_9MICO|nr:hypothetical protein [Glaciihabitans arcticus]TBN57531.1 hypothetical protein EYE40_09090 [Glaciihabitans arcticus]
MRADDRRPARLTTLALAALAAGFVLGGCAPPGTRGPLAVPEDTDETCMPTTQYPSAAIGTILTNKSSGELHITRVELRGADNLDLGDSSLMPSPGDLLLADKYPPTDQFPDDWPNAEPIADATVAGNENQLVLVTQVTPADPDRTGSFAGLDIYYTDSRGKEYLEPTQHSLRMTPGSCKPGQ